MHCTIIISSIDYYNTDYKVPNSLLSLYYLFLHNQKRQKDTHLIQSILSLYSTCSPNINDFKTFFSNNRNSAFRVYVVLLIADIQVTLLHVQELESESGTRKMRYQSLLYLKKPTLNFWLQSSISALRHLNVIIPTVSCTYIVWSKTMKIKLC